jgi:hypothetical protein
MSRLKSIRTFKSVNSEERDTPLDLNEPIIRHSQGSELLTFNQIKIKYEIGSLVHTITDICDSRTILIKLGKLLSDAKFERLYAEQNGWVGELKFWDKICDHLMDEYKILNSINMSYGTEAKFVGLT